MAGIDEANIFLLIVSHASLVSKNVEVEYQRALKQKKRIILVIFEAAPLPTHLQACEWVDFRGSFGKNYKKLLAQLDAPSPPSSPPPQTGFKTSTTVWLAFAISLIMVVISIPSWWTLFIPSLLIPLPLQILKRNFHFYRARFATLILPLALFLSWVFFLAYPFTNKPFEYCLFASLITSPALLLLLSSKGMRVWGKPSASAPQFARLYRPTIKDPESSSFFIEYAPEDQKYADAIANRLIKFGHLQVERAQQAQVNFAIISGYKNTISTNPERYFVLPVIVQDAEITDKIIQRIQWIDFRRGMKNLDNLAKLLAEPENLTKALGVAPISEQGAYPRIIQILDYFLTLLAFFSIGIWIPLTIEFGAQFLQYKSYFSFVFVNLTLSATILSSVFILRRALISRKGDYASLGRLVGSLLWVGFVSFTQTVYLVNVIITMTVATRSVLETSPRGAVVLFMPFSFILGMLLLFLLGVWNWRDLTRWFPQKQGK